MSPVRFLVAPQNTLSDYLCEGFLFETIILNKLNYCIMKKDLCPSVDALLKVDYKKPYQNWLDLKYVILLALAVISLICIFLPWMNVGVSAAGDSVKLRAFGFATTCGIFGLIACVVAVAATLYRQYALTFCASVVAVFVGIFAVNSYPDCKVVLGYSNSATETMVESQLAANGISPDATLKVPGEAVALVSIAAELADQELFQLVANGNPKLKYVPFGQFDIINNRWGAILFLIFSVLTALFSYAVIKHGDKFLKEKNEAAPQAE